MKRIVATAADISDVDFPKDGSRLEQVGFLLNYAILAPSVYNTQPWQFDISQDGIELYADRTRMMPVRDPHGRQLVLSCGAALFYLRLAARHFGYSVRVETFPGADNIDLLARVELPGTEAVTAKEEGLFQAIPIRHTNRNKFRDTALPATMSAELRDAALQEGSLLLLVESEEDTRNIAELVAEADRIQWADKRFRNELAAWLRTSSSVSYDGVHTEALGLGDFLSYSVPQIVRNLDLGSDRAAHDAQLVQGPGAVAIVGTETDDAAGWLSAGQALAHVLLHAAGSGLSASFINQPIEIAPLRLRLRELCDCAPYPQVAMRIGYGPDVPATLRRSARTTQI